jgi:uncharacterized protein (TIGR02996 family)
MKNPVMQAVIDDPEDMTARLVFADWEEEYGDPLLASFVRLQMVGRNDILQQALLHAYGFRWSGFAAHHWAGEPVMNPVANSLPAVEWRYGLPYRVVTTKKQWVDIGKRIPLHPVVAITCQNAWAARYDFKYVWTREGSDLVWLHEQSVLPVVLYSLLKCTSFDTELLANSALRDALMEYYRDRTQVADVRSAD